MSNCPHEDVDRAEELLKEACLAVCADWPKNRDGMDYAGPVPTYVQKCRNALDKISCLHD